MPEGRIDAGEISGAGSTEPRPRRDALRDAPMSGRRPERTTLPPPRRGHAIPPLTPLPARCHSWRSSSRGGARLLRGGPRRFPGAAGFSPATYRRKTALCRSCATGHGRRARPQYRPTRHPLTPRTRRSNRQAGTNRHYHEPNASPESPAGSAVLGDVARREVLCDAGDGAGFRPMAARAPGPPAPHTARSARREHAGLPIE